MATAFVACPVPRGLSVNFGHCEGRAMVKRTRRFRFVPSKTSIQKCPTVISAKQSTCVRCGETFTSHENFPGSCRYHGDIMGNPQPLNLYEDHHFDDPALDHVKGPRYGRRWACCQDTDPGAPPCKSGVHVTYDCPPERWTEALKFEVQ